MSSDNIEKDQELIKLEIDLQGNIVFLSDAWNKYAGIAPQKLLNSPFIEILHKKSKATFKDFLENEDMLEARCQLYLKIDEQVLPKIALLVKDLTQARIKIEIIPLSTVEEDTSTKHDNHTKKTDHTSILQEKVNNITNFFNQIGRTAKIGGWELYLENMHVVWSEETYRIHELAIGTKIILEEAINFYHPDYRHIVQDRVQKLIESGGVYDEKLKLITAKGNVLWVRAWGKREMREGKPYKLYGVFQDIDQQVGSEEILRENEQRFRLISENSADLICIHEPDGTYRYVSPSSQTLLGYRPNELVGKNPYDYFNKEDAERIIKESHEAVLAGQNTNIQYRFKKADGSYMWLETVSSSIFTNGQVTKIITFSRDITERKIKEHTLITEEKRLKMALNASKTGIWEWYVNEGRIIWDENVERLYGLKKGEFDGTFVMYGKFIHPEDKDILFDKIQEFAKDSSKEWHVTHRIINKNGKLLWLEGAGEMFFDQNGVPIYMIGVTSDITQSKLQEEAIAEQNEKLLKTNKELDNFVYRISHDLRAPVSSSLGLLNLAKLELADTEDQEEKLQNVEEFLDLLNKSMKRMDGFIGDILDYSRNTRMVPEYEPINLHELVNDIYHQNKFLNNKVDVQLFNNIQPDKLLISDALRLNMILSNFISNSFKFYDRQKSEHHIKINATWKEKEILLEISDNGSGIAPGHQDKIFDMFYRASDQEIGSGLGLYIVKESVERIKGTIKLSSELGVGTTFTLAIPFDENTNNFN